MNCVLFPPISNDVLEKIFCSTQLSFKKKKITSNLSLSSITMNVLQGFFCQLLVFFKDFCGKT